MPEMSPNTSVARDELTDRAGERPNDQNAGKHKGLGLVHRMRPVSALVSVAAITVLVLHIAEPKWKIDSIALALLVVAALPWLGEILESVDFPGGGGFRYRDRLKSVEDKATDVEGQVAALREILPLLLPPYLMEHLQNLAYHKTWPYYTDQPLINNLRTLRGMGLIELLPTRKSEKKGIGSLADVHEFDLAHWVRLTRAGERWVMRAAELGQEQPRVEN